MRSGILMLCGLLAGLSACTTITSRDQWSLSGDSASSLRDDCRTLQLGRRPGDTATLVAGSPNAVLLRMQGVELAICAFPSGREIVRATGPFLPLIVVGHVPVGQDVPAIHLGLRLRGLPGGANALRISGLQLSPEGQSDRNPAAVPASTRTHCDSASNASAVSPFDLAPGVFLTLCFPLKPNDVPQGVVTLRFDYEVAGAAAKGSVALRLERAQGHYFTWSDL